jgi:hypothetical protein
MAHIKKVFTTRNLFLLALGFLSYQAWLYFGLASKIPEDKLAISRAKGVLNNKYYAESQNLVNDIAQNPSDENLQRLRERTDYLYRQNGILNGTPSGVPGQTPATATCEEPRKEFNPPEKLLGGVEAYEVQLDARQGWTDVITVEGPATVEVSAGRESRVCSPPDISTGPEGHLGLAKYSRVNPEHYPVGDAAFNSLVGRLDNSPGFQIGESKRIAVPSGTHVLRMTSNIRTPWLHEASGGFQLTMVVSK